MATLYVRDVPDDLYERLRSTAESERRSIGATTVEILRRELPQPSELSTSELLSRARAVRDRSRPVADSATVAQDIRADRER
jgi:plasmid stability protein